MAILLDNFDRGSCRSAHGSGLTLFVDRHERDLVRLEAEFLPVQWLDDVVRDPARDECFTVAVLDLLDYCLELNPLTQSAHVFEFLPDLGDARIRLADLRMRFPG